MADRPVTDAQLAKWDYITTEAPAGPWRYGHHIDDTVHTYAVDSETGPVCFLTGDQTEDLDDDQRREIEAALSFVAMARTAMPLLVAEVRRLRGQEK
jgi:hypothetical protein